MQRAAPPQFEQRNANTAHAESVLGEAAIRTALRARLLDQFPKGSDTVLIEELGLNRGSARIDIAVVNGHLHGFEIKSDRDNLRRLTAQVHLYSKVFDHATLVTGGRLLDSASELVPAWWGVLHALSTPSGLRFRTVRRARRNPQRDARVLAELLWADQAIALLEQRGAARGMRGKPRRIVWDRVCDQCNIDEIAAAVRTLLKARSASQVPA